MTISIQTLAWILAIMHAGSAIFMAFVIRRQFKLFSYNVTYDDSRFEEKDIHRIKRFRLGLFLLSCVVLLGNVVPIAIDALTIFGSSAATGRPTHVHTISILYAISNALTALISAYLISTLYRIARGVNDPNALVEKDLNRRK
jgi:hypothetical protein